MRATDTRGFTLLEVILTLAIFTFIAAGISRTLIMTRSMAETNVREISAISAASGYIEQIKSMEYGKILTSINDSDIPLPTILSQGEPDPILIGQWVTKMITIDEELDAEEPLTMPFHIRLEIDNLRDSGNGPILGISVFFAWEAPKSGIRVERSLRTMRSIVLTP